MTVNHNEEKIITAINNLKAQGVLEFTSNQIATRVMLDSRQRYNLMPYRELYRCIAKLLGDKVIEFGSDANHYKAVKNDTSLVKVYPQKSSQPL